MPKKHVSPFVSQDGRWFLDPRRRTAAMLRDALDDLLERHGPDELLLLRPMTPGEVRLMDEYRANYEAELLSRMVVEDEKRRVGGRKHPS